MRRANLGSWAGMWLDGRGIKTLETAYAEEEYAFAVQKGNQELLNVVNEVINELESSGKLDDIKAKFIK